MHIIYDCLTFVQYWVCLNRNSKKKEIPYLIDVHKNMTPKSETAAQN